MSASLATDLIITAQRLAKASASKPRQADLRRAVSTAYYALFHALAKDAADMLVGSVRTNRSNKAWSQAYRALEHGFAKNGCKQARNLGFTHFLTICADAFVELQELRHAADYDPDMRFGRDETLALVRKAEEAIASLEQASKKDRRAFAVHLLLKRRS